MAKPEGKGSKTALVPIIYFSKKLHGAESPLISWELFRWPSSYLILHSPWRFITIFKKGSTKGPCSWASSTHSTPYHTSLRPFFSKLFCLTLLPPFRFPSKSFIHFTSHLILPYSIIQKKYTMWHNMHIMKLHIMQFPTRLHFFICLRFKCSPWQFVFKPSIYRVSKRSLYTWHIYLFHHTCISFDPVHLCGHPHGQQRAWYIATSFVTSSVALKEAKASVMMASFYQTQSNVVLHFLPLVSVHTWVVKVQGEWLQWYMSWCGIFGWLLHRESFTFPYEKAHFFHDKRVALCWDGFSNHCWNDVITSFIAWPELSLYASPLATKCSTVE